LLFGLILICRRNYSFEEIHKKVSYIDSRDIII